MTEAYRIALKGLESFKNLTPRLADFFIDYFELFNVPGGCKESNQYFATREGVGLSTIEVRFKKLRDAKIIQTEINYFYQPDACNNPSGYITSRVITIDPVFKAKLEDLARRVQDRLNELKGGKR